MVEMKAIFTTFFIILLTTIICFSQGTKGVQNLSVTKLPSVEKRWAIIIGVNNYGLQGAVNDAKALKDVLIKYAGFPEKQVILLTTDNPNNPPTRRNIILELNKLSRKIEPDGFLLFAFSGHGKTINDKGFLIPADGEWSDNTNLLEQLSINVNEIKRAIEEMKVKQVLMLIDACRDRIEAGQKGNDSEPLTDAINRGFSFYEANKSVEAFVTFYASRIGEYAYEYFDSETNQTRGYFSKAIEEALSGKANIANDKGEITLSALVKFVQENVPKRSYQNNGKRQTPFKNSNDGFNENELILAVVRETVNLEAQSNVKLSLKTEEQIFWEDVNRIGTISAYEKYLKEFPSGQFHRTARLKIGDLKWQSIKLAAKSTLKYDFVGGVSEDFILVQMREKFGFIDKEGKVIIPIKFDEAKPFSEGLAVVGINKGEVDCGGDLIPNISYGYINKSGKIVIPAIYTYANDFSQGLAGVANMGFGFINKSNYKIIPLKYDFWLGDCIEPSLPESSFKFNLAPIAKDITNGNVKEATKYGFIDKKNKIVVPLEYDSVNNFSDGLALVLKERKFGFIDEFGRIRIQLQFDDASSFAEKLAFVKKDQKWHIIDLLGTVLKTLDSNYDNIMGFSNGMAQVSYKGKIGFINKIGVEVIPVKYDEIWSYAHEANGFIGVILNGKKGFVDIYGNEYFDF